MFRAPVEAPVTTSFGVMRDRPAVFVRVEDGEGVVGWGEIWCNFPACGAEHRARLVADVFAPLLIGRKIADPDTAFRELTQKTAVLAIQSGEHGPITQCIAGIDIALWDLAARRDAQPLWQHLGGVNPKIHVYASGINPDRPQELALRKMEEGYNAFKLKVGFGQKRDIANLAALRQALGDECRLMADANQAWDLDSATRMCRHMAEFDLGWLEEPLRADRPWVEWQDLAGSSSIALAAGENLAGEAAFEAALASRALQTVQPDMAKWGGFSGCLPVAKRILAANANYCPHYLGGGIGLLASAHLLAAAGGNGMLEIDANPNPLRTLLSSPLGSVRKGGVKLGRAPGLGIEPDLDRLREYAVR